MIVLNIPTVFWKSQRQESSVIPTAAALREDATTELDLHNTKVCFSVLPAVSAGATGSAPSGVHSREAADLVVPADSAFGPWEIDGDQLLRRGAQRRQQPLLAVPRLR